MTAQARVGADTAVASAPEITKHADRLFGATNNTASSSQQQRHIGGSARVLPDLTYHSA